MEIIDELEPSTAGVYGGAVGYLAADGDLDTCICIRTVVVKVLRKIRRDDQAIEHDARAPGGALVRAYQGGLARSRRSGSHCRRHEGGEQQQRKRRADTALTRTTAHGSAT